MRDIKRIDRILQKVGEHWKKNPDLRFGQIVGNLYYTHCKVTDPFYIEDGIFEIGLDQQILNDKND